MSATAFQRMRREAAAKAEAEVKANEEANAEVVEVQEEGEPDTKAETELDEIPELKDMTIDQLKEYASDRGIDFGNASSKKGIMKKIKEAE